MNPFFLLPILAGIAVVAQAGVNRQVAGQWGLATMVVVNSVVVLVLALVFFAAVKLRPEAFPEFLRVPVDPGHVAAWRIFLPGLMGITIVMGLPWAFSRLGALEVILTVLVAQVVASMLWDRWVDRIPVEPLRVIGALIALGGTMLASWKR